MKRTTRARVGLLAVALLALVPLHARAGSITVTIQTTQSSGTCSTSSPCTRVFAITDQNLGVLQSIYQLRCNGVQGTTCSAAQVVNQFFSDMATDMMGLWAAQAQSTALAGVQPPPTIQ